jgi:hypothetical protein
MLPHPNVTFGAGSAESTLGLIALAAMLITVVLVLTLPRKWVIAPFLCFIYLVPVGEQLVVGGLHLFAHRIVILCACLRFIFKYASTKNVLVAGFTNIDKVFVIWALCRAAAFVLL